MNLTVNGTKDRKMALELNFSIWFNLVTIPWVCLGLPLFVLGVQNINECPVDTDIPALLIGEKNGPIRNQFLPEDSSSTLVASMAAVWNATLAEIKVETNQLRWKKQIKDFCASKVHKH
jgi:hypothetical protein